MNKVMVKDGAVVRQKTDDTHEDSSTILSSAVVFAVKLSSNNALALIA